MLVNEFHQLKKKNKEKKNTINSVLIKTALILFFEFILKVSGISS